MTDAIVVPLRSRRHRRALTLQKLNHAIPATGLLAAGSQAISEGHGLAFYLGAFEMLSSAVLIILTAREIRSAMRPTTGHAPHDHHGVDWVDIAAGFVLVAELLEHWHLTNHISRPTMLSAATTFAFGLFHGRLTARRAARRVLRVDGEGLWIAGRPFKIRKLQAAWSEVASIEVGERWGIVTTRAGRVRKLDLPDLETEGAVRAALLEARNRLQLSEAGAVPRR